MIVLGALFIRHGISKQISIVDYCAIVHCHDLPTTELFDSFFDDNEKESHRQIKANENTWIPSEHFSCHQTIFTLSSK